MVFIGIIGGTPDKRISEGLFSPLCFYRVFIGILGGTVKHNYEGLFCPLCFCFIGFYKHYKGDPC